MNQILIWIAIGAILRFINLAVKPPWTDEITTIIYTLGNNYQSIPLNKLISLETLLQPLQFNPNAGVTDVISNLLGEDVHPPVYFVLAHLWTNLFPHYDHASIWVARSLPAFLGVLSIPTIYLVAELAFKSSVIASFSAAMMAVSPYGIFLAQEARHYSLAVIFVILSLSCLLKAIRCIEDKVNIPLWLVIVWVIVNGLGIATHYFFSLTLVAEFMALLLTVWQSKNTFHKNNFLTLSAVAIGTFVSGLIWLPSFLNNRASGAHTDWIQSNSSLLAEIFNPIFQALAAWITMISLLPVEADNLAIVIASGVVMLLFFIWAIPILLFGIGTARQEGELSLETQTLINFVGSAIALFFFITYFLDLDLTRGARYNFVYFPGVILLLGISLACNWQVSKRQRAKVVIILLMGFLSSLTVSFNLGYQKYYRPDLLVPIIETSSSQTKNIVIATTHKTLAHKGEMVGIAWELRKYELAEKVEFILVDLDTDNLDKANVTLAEEIADKQQDFDLWLVNFSAPVKLESCSVDEQNYTLVDGYDYEHYICVGS